MIRPHWVIDVMRRLRRKHQPEWQPSPGQNGTHYFQDGLKSVHAHDFVDDPAFCAAYDRGMQACNGTDHHWHWRVHTGLWAARNAAQLAGDFVECGVNQGFLSSAIMFDLSWDKLDKQFYLLDTFCGLDDSLLTTEEKNSQEIQNNQHLLSRHLYTAKLEEVSKNFSEWKNHKIIPGSVPDTLAAVEADSVAFLHIDMNCVTPEIEAFKFFWPKMVAGGLVLLDDYGFTQHREQKRGFDTLAANMGFQILSLPTGQGLILKNSV